MPGVYPEGVVRKQRLRGGRSVAGMLLLGCWVLIALQGPAQGPATPLVLGLAAVAVALLVVLAAAAVIPLPPRRPAAAGVGLAARARIRRLPRLLDPDAAGRPRPRAPSAYPAVVFPAR
jgi:hypothetical protein